MGWATVNPNTVNTKPVDTNPVDTNPVNTRPGESEHGAHVPASPLCFQTMQRMCLGRVAAVQGEAIG